ncbi:autotransporter adhesin family protein [Escherichia coli]|nr:autotransporter adhesin family protein [Escherichia coli]
MTTDKGGTLTGKTTHKKGNKPTTSKKTKNNDTPTNREGKARQI